MLMGNYILFCLILNVLISFILFFYFKEIHFNFYIFSSLVLVIILLILYNYKDNLCLNVIKLILFILLFIICMVDLKSMIIPDFILFLLIILYLFLRIQKLNIIDVNEKEIKLGIVVIILSMIIHLIFLNVFNLELIGFGDLKLLFIFNLFIGFINVLIVLFISSLLGCLFEIFIFKRKKFPFGPYLVFAFCLLIFLL